MKNTGTVILALIAITVGALAIWYLLDIVTYVFIAWVISMVGQPLMSFLQRIKIGKFKMGSSLAAGLTLVSFFLGFGLLVSIFIPLVIEQARNLAAVDVDSVLLALEQPINSLKSELVNRGILSNADKNLFNNIGENLASYFEPSQISGIFSAIISTFGNVLIGVFSIAFISFFFLKEQGLFLNVILAITPSSYADYVTNTIEETSKLLTRYFGGILIQIIIITFIVSTGLMIFGIKNALLIGFFAALINVIPYLGPLIGAIFGIFITISSNLDLDFYHEMLPLLTKLVLVFVCMQLIDNFLIQPLIFSNSVMAHPLEIFIVILIAARIGGIGGMIVAIPVYTIIRVIAKVFLSEFRLVQKLTKSMRDV